MIYFARCTHGSGKVKAGWIKIGKSDRLSVRLKQIVYQTKLSIKVVGVHEGSYVEEKEVHRRFSHLQQDGEWFLPGEELLTYIAQECREWTDDQCKAVMLPREVVRKAKVIAAIRKMDMVDVICEIIEAPLTEAYLVAWEELTTNGV